MPLTSLEHPLWLARSNSSSCHFLSPVLTLLPSLQQQADLSHHGKGLSTHEEGTCGDMGLIPLTQGGRSILTLISWLKPPPSLTVISRPVFHIHH